MSKGALRLMVVIVMIVDRGTLFGGWLVLLLGLLRLLRLLRLQVLLRLLLLLKL